MHIADATSIQDHIEKAASAEFYLSKAIPLPKEIDTSLKAVSNYHKATLEKHWNATGGPSDPGTRMRGHPAHLGRRGPSIDQTRDRKPQNSGTRPPI